MNKIIELLNRLSLDQLEGNVMIALGDHAIFIDGNQGIASENKIEVTATIHIDSDDILSVLQGDKNIIMLLYQDKVTLEGDKTLALKVKELLV